MAFNKRLLNTGGGAAASCTTDSADIFSGGVALYNLDYDASDASGSYNGSASNVTFGVGGKINTGARFNGSNSYISIANGGIGNNATARVTYSISLWIKTTSTSVGAIISDYASYYSLYIQMETNGRLYMGNYYTSGGSDFTYGTTTINDGNWHNLVIINNTSDNTQKLFIDGSNTPDINHTLSTGTKTSSALQVGYYSSTGGYYLDGDIDQIRFFTSALTEAQMDTLYAETACVYTSTTDIVNYPTGTTPVAYYKLDNSSEDFSTGGNDGTDTNIEYRFGRFGQAAVFNGSSSRITLPKLTGLTADVTVSGWVNLGSTTTSNRIRFIELNTNANGYAGTISIYYKPSNGEWQARSGNGTSSDSNVLTHTYTLTQSIWYHVCFTRDDSSNVTKFYVNGSLQDTETVPASSSYTSGATSIIGDINYSTGSNYNWNGSIDQVRIYQTALSASNVTDLYNEKPEVDTSNFKAVLYEGNGGTNFISNVGFEPDLVWVKARDDAHDHVLYDTVRGVGSGKALSSSENYAEGAYDATYGFLDSFEATGFVAKTGSSFANYTNKNNESYVAWNWKAGGVASNITSSSSNVSAASLSANAVAGFSIATYTTNSDSPVVIPHGLDSPPKVALVKRTDSASDWFWYNTVVSGLGRGFLNTDSAFDNAGLPTLDGTNITFAAGDPFSSGSSAVIYFFANVAGYSKIGTYSGNANNNGPTTNTGFEPSFLLIKNTTASKSWRMFDNKRGYNSSSGNITKHLAPDTSSQENTDSNNRVKFTSTGFQMVTASASFNQSGTNNFLYMAIA